MTEQPLTAALCTKGSNSFADKLAKWLQQAQTRQIHKYPDFDPEPGWDAYLDKQGELHSQVSSLPDSPDLQAGSHDSDRGKLLRHGHCIINSGLIGTCDSCGDKFCKEGRGTAELCDECLNVSGEASGSDIDTHQT